MQFKIKCGDYETVIDRPSAKQAAVDALALWEHKADKPQLSSITVVSAGDKVIYLKTLALMNDGDRNSM